MKDSLHADAEGLVVVVNESPDGGLASQPWAADSGEDRGDNLVAEDKQGGDGTGRLELESGNAATGLA
jgi:hypothetical protein